MSFFSSYRPATSQITNSTIQPWLDFNGTVPAGFPRCKPDLRSYEYLDGRNMSLEKGQDQCLYACNSSYWSSLDPDTISTCGMWVSLMMMRVNLENAEFYISDNASDLKAQYQNITDQLRKFDDPLMGLGYVDTTYLSMVQWMLSDVLRGYLPRGNNADVSSFDVPVACANLFPIIDDISVASMHSVYDWEFFMNPLHQCLGRICSSNRLNPDLGGIGVCGRIC